MATGAAPALEPKRDAKNETKETVEVQPLTLKQRIERLCCEIFQGHEEYLGWHQ